MVARLLIVLGILALIAVAPALWRARLERAPASAGAVVPETLLDGSERTWVVFTTPWCASCGPVEARLREAEPAARVVLVDATAQAGLARALAVRSAPTALLADRAGRVEERLVGPEAVDRYLGRG